MNNGIREKQTEKSNVKSQEYRQTGETENVTGERIQKGKKEKSTNQETKDTYTRGKENAQVEEEVPKCGRSVLLTTHPLLVPRSLKSRAIPLPTFWAKPGL